jgi:DNA-binding MarR family transcriptional regulator
VNAPCICVALRRLARKATALYESELSAAGLTLTQYSALVRLERRGTCSLSELAGEVDLDVATLSRKVAPLVDQGWLAVSIDARDRRAKHYALTATGKRVLRRAETGWRRAQRTAARLVPVERVAELTRLSDAFDELARARP